ncbi:hypothetical protein [Pseudomonas phage D6]|nr:hypothetical protein [Pseudomonas phage D6]
MSQDQTPFTGRYPFLSRKNKKRLDVLRHNERYEAAMRGEPFETDDVGPRGEATQEHADSLGEALGHMFVNRLNEAQLKVYPQ